MFDEMELMLDVACKICRHCDSANMLPGFSTMMVFTCKHRGEVTPMTRRSAVSSVAFEWRSESPSCLRA